MTNIVKFIVLRYERQKEEKRWKKIKTYQVSIKYYHHGHTLDTIFYLQ